MVSQRQELTDHHDPAPPSVCSWTLRDSAELWTPRDDTATYDQHAQEPARVLGENVEAHAARANEEVRSRTGHVAAPERRAPVEGSDRITLGTRPTR
jgi:hypothetical protein